MIQLLIVILHFQEKVIIFPFFRHFFHQMKVIKKPVVCHSMTHLHINKVQNSTYIRPVTFNVLYKGTGMNSSRSEDSQSFRFLSQRNLGGMPKHSLGW